MKHKKLLGIPALVTIAAMLVSLSACSTENTETTSAIETLTEEDIDITDEITDSSDGGHAIEADGQSKEYSNIKVTKTGDSDAGDEADFYGDNAAVFATNGATLDLTEIAVETNGTHANAVFSYGEGTTVNIGDSVITTSGNCSGGLMTTGGGTMNADNCTVHTSGNSSAAIRSDRGGGTVTVTGGSYTTDGTGSPVIYSTADITVSDAYLESTASQGVVVEGQNSVTLNDVTLVADNNTKNSDKSDYYQAIMIYQSMSGDADQGLAEFTMTGSSLTNVNGDIFFVNNTTAAITLEDTEIINQDADGLLLRACAAGWGTEGSNGGKVDFYLKMMDIEGDIAVDSISALNLYLSSDTVYEGSVNADNEGEVYVEIDSGSKWILTGDSYVTSLTCDEDAIDLNGYTLYVDGVAYQEGASSAGEAIDMEVSSSAGQGMPDEPPMGTPGDGNEPPARPEGEPPMAMPGDGNEPPARPEDN